MNVFEVVESLSIGSALVRYASKVTTTGEVYKIKFVRPRKGCLVPVYIKIPLLEGGRKIVQHLFASDVFCRKRTSTSKFNLERKRAESSTSFDEHDSI